jgi:hypothetical protein
MVDTEVWRPVVGYEGLYDVSNKGRVLSKARVVEHSGHPRRVQEKVLKASPDSAGYPVVTLSVHGETNKVRVHVIEMAAFFGPCPQGQRVLHWDDNPGNNAITNLRYGTQLENLLDCVRNGHHASTRKTRCSNGHEFTAANTRIFTPKNGRPRRVCVKCKQKHTAATALRRKQERRLKRAA